MVDTILGYRDMFAVLYVYWEHNFYQSRQPTTRWCNALINMPCSSCANPYVIYIVNEFCTLEDRIDDHLIVLFTFKGVRWWMVWWLIVTIFLSKRKSRKYFFATNWSCLSCLSRTGPKPITDQSIQPFCAQGSTRPKARSETRQDKARQLQKAINCARLSAYWDMGCMAMHGGWRDKCSRREQQPLPFFLSVPGKTRHLDVCKNMSRLSILAQGKTSGQ